MSEHNARLIQVDGHKLVMQPLSVTGSGIPVVLIHGAIVSLSFFIPPLVPLFAGDRDAFSLSLPGHYPAAFPANFTDGDFTAESYKDVMVEAVRQSFGGAPVILVGHSTGGFAALAIAARAPNLVRGVICVAGFAKGEAQGMLRLMQELAGGGALQLFLFRTFLSLTRLSPGMIRSTFRMWPGMVGSRRSYNRNPHLKELSQALYPNLRALDLNDMALALRRMLDIDITDWLPDISAPTLVIAGTKDGVVSPDQSRLIAEQIPGAALHMMEGLGHVLFMEEPEAFEAILSDWYAAHNL